MPLQATSGAASYDAFGGGVAAVPNYIEECFSTFLYQGNGSTQTINNGIDLAGKGGLVWTKSRNVAGSTHALQDTVRGANNYLQSQTTSANINLPDINFAFNSNGFSQNNTFQAFNNTGDTYASWTFREQPKFFDVVTWSGNDTARTIAHNLGSVPGCIIVKSVTGSGVQNWRVYHRSLGATKVLSLNLTSAESASTTIWNDTEPTSTVFSVGTSSSTNGSGQTYVAYLFAHNAGGFGLSGTDNVISCGSFTPDANGAATVNLGYEPQWILYKNAASTGGWNMYDTMRGWGQTTAMQLFSNSSQAEQQNASSPYFFFPTATGFQSTNDWFAANQNHIYIAIRRGPMRTPTTGTSVFTPVARTGTRAAGSVTGIGFPPDNLITLNRTPGGYNPEWNNKLVGPTKYLRTSTTGSELTSTDLASYDQDGVSFNATDFNSIVNLNSPLIQYFLRRAPGFMDVCCYTGTGSATTFAHNLTVVPELMIVKRRSGAADWAVYASAIGNTKFLLLNSTGDTITDNVWNNTTPTATEFSVRDQNTVNASGSTYVAYLFATVAGVSKVGSYTGTGATQVINCGFTGGARFVLIKRSSGTGDWYVWDTARGIVAGNDPYLLLNSTAAEVTNTDFIDTAATGFEISSTAPAAINASGGTFIFLAIA